MVFDKQTKYRARYKDVPLQILDGMRDSARNIVNFLWQDPAAPIILDNIYQEIISDKPIERALNPIHLPNVPPPDTTAGVLTNGINQFIIGFLPMVRATKFIKPLQKIGW